MFTPYDDMGKDRVHLPTVEGKKEGVNWYRYAVGRQDETRRRKQSRARNDTTQAQPKKPANAGTEQRGGTHLAMLTLST